MNDMLEILSILEKHNKVVTSHNNQLIKILEFVESIHQRLAKLENKNG